MCNRSQPFYDGPPPEVRPLAKISGDPSCIENGEANLPLPLLTLIDSTSSTDSLPLIRTGEFPDLRVDFGAIDDAEVEGLAAGLGVASANVTVPTLEGLAAGLGVASANVTVPTLEGLAAGLGVASGSIGGGSATIVEGLAAGLGVAEGAAVVPAAEGMAIGLGVAEGELDAGPAIEGMAIGVGVAEGELVAGPPIEGMAIGLGVAEGELEEAEPIVIHWTTASPPATLWNDVWITDATGGTFRLRLTLDDFDPGEWTGDIPWDADAATVAAAVAATSYAAFVDSVTGSGTAGDHWRIQYIDADSFFGVAETDDSSLTQ